MPSSLKLGKLCQECREREATYQCPRCYRKTCSLKCCQAHKSRLKCNGKRDRTQFQRLEHMSDATLQSDFLFLEDVLRNVNAGKRLLKDVGARNTSSSNNDVLLKRQNEDQTISTAAEEPAQKRPKTWSHSLAPKWRRLTQQAEERRVKLLLMPPGMERHKRNTSFYNSKAGTIFWRVEFIFGGTTFSLNSVSEDGLLIDEWKKCRIAQRGDVRMLWKQQPCPSNQPRYFELDKESALKDVLQDKTIIEYPTIYVCLATDLNKFPRAMQEVVERKLVEAQS